MILLRCRSCQEKTTLRAVYGQNEDRRFVIYPNRYRDEVRDTNFTNDFWTDYTASYDNVNVIRQQNEAGLGQGYASMTLISFVTPPDEPMPIRQG